MPQLAANLIFNSSQPNFARDQVQTMEELFTYGGWNVGDPRYDDSNEANLTKIDLGHITFVVETNQHYTYVRINEVDEHDQLTGGYHYGWVVFDGGSGEEASPDPGSNPGSLGLYTYFKSLVFKRGLASQAPATPEGGSFSNPVPQGWSDGVPAVTVEGEEAIWMSTRIFSSALEDPTALNGSTDPVQGNWTTPSLIADTEWKDFEFSELEELDVEHAVPDKTYPSDTSTNGWSNTATEGTIWMAMRDVESGAYKAGSSWEVVKIKGEDGEQALKIKICGQLSNVSGLEGIANPEYLDAYVIGNDIYVWDGDSWENSGPFRGTYDNTKDWAYLHIKYSDDGGVSFTAFGGEVPGKWVGTYCDYVIQDSSNVAHYFWKQVSGGDSYGYEYIYKLTSDDQAPDVPDDHENDNDDDWNDFDFVPNNWTDNPGGIDETFRWCWVCYRVFVNGQWSEFKGAQGKTAAENGVAALYAHYAVDNIANSASRSFMIFTWTNLNTSLQVPAPYVPLKPGDNAARWDAVNNVLVLNSGQSWNWSNNGQTGIWSTNPGNAQAKFLWMSTATFSEAEGGQIIGSWSDPVRLTGDDGRNGTDGISTAFGYHLCDDMTEFSALVAPTLTDSTDNDSFVSGSGWTDHPQGISPAHPIEAASVGTYNEQNGTWSYGTPFIWARWGEDGIDGDGIEYLFYVATESDVVKTDIMEAGQKVGENVELENLNWLPMTAAQLSEFLGGDQEKIDAFYYDHNTEWLPSGCGWTDDPSDIGPFQPYEFVSIRRYSAADGRWEFWSEPALWAKYGKDGTNGRSVFTSFAFTRTTLDLSTAKVFGGTTADPRPTSTKNAAETETINVTWTDSVPSNSNAPVWMTSRIFDDSLTGEGTGWKTPTKLQDTPEFQVEYTNEEVWDTSALPSLNDYIDWVNFPLEGIDELGWRQAAYTATAAHWGDIGEGQNDIVDPWWMITARRSNGVWSSWAIHKIKGEKGEPGTSISVKGSLSSYTDLGDLNGSPAGQVDHSSISVGDCYVINGLLWIYDDNSTKTSPYSTTYVTDSSGTGQILGDKYAGFSCQGQFKGDPGDTSWIHIRFANKSEDQSTSINNSTIGYRYYYNNEVYIEFTGNDHSGVVPGKYAGIAVTSDANVAPSSITAYEWTEWRGDDIYGTEQIFTLSAERPATPTRPNNVSEVDWYTFNYVPRIPIAGTDPVEYQEWSDTPLEATSNAHCWVSTRRLSDTDDNGWKTPVIYSRYAQDGDDGIDGSVNEFIYHLGDKGTAPQIVLSSAKKGNTVESDPTAAWWASDDSRDYCPADSNSGYWTDNPQGVADASGQRVEYYAYRTRDYDDEHNRYTWTSWSPVKVWSSWGQKGHDGDGVEYIFTMTETYDTPDTPTSDNAISANEPAKNWGDYDFVPKVAIAGTDPVEYQVWTDDPQEVDSTDRYQWVSMRRSHADSNGDAQWTDFSVPVLWNKYTEDGKDGRTEEFIYILSKFNNNQPIAPTIDATKAFGVVDNTPQYYGIEPNTEPDWQELEDFLPALGNPTALYPNNPSGNVIWWNDSPQSISEEWPLEYCASRFKKDGVWSNWGTPYIWSSWGQRGHDGDGVEYIFTRTANKDVVPVLTAETGAFTDYSNKSWTDDDFVPRTSIPDTNPVEYLVWTDDPQGVTKDLRVEWVAIRKTYEGEWPTSGARKCWSDPKIWKEYDDSILEEEIYHYGGKTTDPTLSATVDYKGRTTIEGTPVYALDGFIPADTSAAPYYSGDSAYDPNGWTPFMKGIDTTNKYEYKAVRKKNPDTGVWGSFRISRIAAWGDDGKYSQFVYFRSRYDLSSYTPQENSSIVAGNYGFYDTGETGWTTNSDGEVLPVFKYRKGTSTTDYIVSSIQANTLPTSTSNNPFRTSTSTSSAVVVTDDPQGATDTWKYEYESMGVFDPSTNIWKFSKPSLHNYKAEDGEPGQTRVDLFKVLTDLTVTPTITATATRATQESAGWHNLSTALASVPANTTDYNIWVIYANYAVDGSEDSQQKTWSGPQLYIPTRKGTKGDDGDSIVVRGPVKWTNDVARSWNSGDTSENGIKYIDIVIYDGNYYKCTTSYTQNVNATWNSVSSNWTSAGDQYKFVAADLLLAPTAKINFLTNNELLLTYIDTDNNQEVVSGGAKGGTGVNFWSGGTSSTDSNNKFTVDYRGNLTSTAGTIGGWAIGPNSLSATGGNVSSFNGAILTNNLPEISLSGSSTSAYSYGWWVETDTSDYEIKLTASGLSGSGSVTTTRRNAESPSATVLDTATKALDLSISGLSLNKTSTSGNGTFGSKLTSDELTIQGTLGNFTKAIELSGTSLNLTLQSSTDISSGNYISSGTYSSGYAEVSFDGTDDYGNNINNKITINPKNPVSGYGGICVFSGNTLVAQIKNGGDIKADDIEATNISASGTVVAGKVSADNFKIPGPGTVQYKSVVSSVGALQLKIAIVVDSFSTAQSLFTQDGGGTYWLFNGTNTYVRVADFPNLSTSLLSHGGTEVVFLTSNNDKLSTGVVLSTNLERLGDTIYIEI